MIDRFAARVRARIWAVTALMFIEIAMFAVTWKIDGPIAALFWIALGIAALAFVILVEDD